jgi:hypothetical protein
MRSKQQTSNGSRRRCAGLNFDAKSADKNGECQRAGNVHGPAAKKAAYDRRAVRLGQDEKPRPTEPQGRHNCRHQAGIYGKFACPAVASGPAAAYPNVLACNGFQLR